MACYALMWTLYVHKNTQTLPKYTKLICIFIEHWEQKYVEILLTPASTSCLRYSNANEASTPDSYLMLTNF